MPGPIQSAISNVVGEVAKTAVDVKQIKAQQKTAAELEATRKENAEIRDIQSRTEAGRSYVASLENAVSNTLDKVDSMKKYAKKRPSEKLQAAINSVATSYYNNPSKIIELGYAKGDINPETGQKYTELEYAKAIHEQLYADRTVFARTMRQQKLFGDSKAKREAAKKNKANKETE